MRYRPIHQIPESVLELVAGVVAGIPVTVFVSFRLANPVSVLLKQNIICLSPDATLYDLFVCAELLGGDQPRLKIGFVLGEEQTRQCFEAARDRVHTKYPNITTYSGILNGLYGKEVLPEITRGRIKFHPKRKNLKGIHHSMKGLVRFQSIVGAEFDFAGISDFEALIQAAESGQIPCEDSNLLPEAKILRVARARL